MTKNPSIDFIWQTWRKRIDQRLDEIIPKDTITPSPLHSAMRYVTLGAGKRYRAALVYATGRTLGNIDKNLDDIACAVELVHAFSLVHDDLPAMDDDDLRRGKASCHRAFGEATAILAGDALQTLAYEILCLTDSVKSSGTKVKMLKTLTHAAGSKGLAGGQIIDLGLVSSSATLETLNVMHSLKTGALIEAAVQLGALSATEDVQIISALNNYAKPLGLAFQIIDDILDETSDTITLGKTTGADKSKEKPTFFTVLGEKRSRECARNLGEEAIKSLERIDLDCSLLIALANFTIDRIF